jgi:hypothetical protein
MSRCEQKSYWLAGVKVRSGEATALTASGSLRVVCRTGCDGEINVRDLKTGTAVEVPGVGVLAFDRDHWRGRKGSSVDCEAIAAQLPRGVADRYMKRMMQTRTDTRSVLFAVRSGASGSREAFEMVRRSPESWLELAANEAGDDSLGWGLESVVEAISNPGVLWMLTQSRRGILQSAAMTSLAKAGRADVLCQGVRDQLARCKALKEPWQHRGVALALLQHDGMLDDEHNVLHVLLSEADLVNDVVFDLVKPPSWPGHTLHEGPVGEGVARTLLKQPLETWRGPLRAHCAHVALRMSQNGVPSAAEVLQRLGSYRDEFNGLALDQSGVPISTMPSTKPGPTFVRSTSQDERRAAAHDAWRESVTAIIEARSEGEAESAAEAWMRMGHAKGVEVNVWATAAFDKVSRTQIVELLDEEELREMVPHAEGRTLVVLLNRVGDDELWLKMAAGVHRRACLEAMPVHLLQRTLDLQGDLRTVREVAAARGVLSPVAALDDDEWQVRAAGAAKTRDAGLIEKAVSDSNENVVRVAMRRCLNTDVLDAAAIRIGGSLGAQIEQRAAQVRWFDVANEALRKGEIGVARAAIRELTHEDLLRTLAGAELLSEWVGVQLMQVQKLHSGRSLKR